MPPLDAQRLWARVESLARFTQPELPWTRRAFSELFLQSRDWLREEMEAAGLTVSLDEAGNLVGRRDGRRPGLMPLMTGSHCDTVVGGGRFDGIIGVLAGIEVARAMKENAVELEHPLEVVDFLSEEPSDYGISCVGSRGLSGVLDAAMLAARNPAGETLAEGLRRAGGRPEALSAPLRPAGSVAAFVELHIEQGPVLESEKLPIGIVTHIVGIRRVLIRVLGQPDHAGTTPMDIRRDALVGAAAIIEATHARACALSGRPHYVVATIGRLSLTPNVPNAVPGSVEMVLEVRSDDAGVLDRFAEDVLGAVEQRLAALRLSVAVTHLSRAEPTACVPLVMDAAEAAAADLGYASRRLPSGAGHDAAYLAACGPMGMIFIPCLNGRSHCPEEWIEPAQLLDGARVLYRTLARLDAQLSRHT
ncbi:Zn-dependent hydrolase [Variovorax sp. RA8]|uniref:Zn-dependent hydrolase n=1 Tax=Variovorax sp. (strain JCM 16519 / RA8) TaxID=662548 RepID=UPI001315F636|nr:Zn-dependent hydrolase [Variovorax sp. RA8]VTU15336.1 N-carbamoyl-L-amino acid hydrolase [Variovorax sp. RA8]